ncbi:MAG: DUF447 family protein [Sulfolobales archaeon]
MGCEGGLTMKNKEIFLEKVLRFGHHEAIAVTVGESGEPHAAAMGVRLIRNDLVMYPYINTKTYRNIQAGSEVSLAFTHNALVFCDVVMRPSRLRFKRGRRQSTFVLDADVDFYIEALPKHIVLEDQRALVFMSVAEVYEGVREYFSYSRANSMLIEALVYFTKLRAYRFKSSLLSEDAKEWLNALQHSISVVKKLGSSELIECVKLICEELRDLGVVVES